MIEKEMLIVSCENLEPSTIAPAEHESKGNADDAKLTEGESSLDVLNFSTTHAMIKQILVDLRTCRVTTSLHVVFDETQFPILMRT